MTIPELNPEMDVYRIGTLLEMVREIAMAVAQDGKKVKICVQQPLGEGFLVVRCPYDCAFARYKRATTPSPSPNLWARCQCQITTVCVSFLMCHALRSRECRWLCRACVAFLR